MTCWVKTLSRKAVKNEGQGWEEVGEDMVSDGDWFQGNAVAELSLELLSL